jgi:hypothetical protein
MIRTKWMCSVIAVLMMLTLSVAASAADKAAGKKKQNASQAKPATISDEAKAVADLNLANQLAAYGRKAENPMALLTAAQIMKNTPTQDEKREKKTEGKAAAEKGTKAGELSTPESLLAEAAKLAEGKGMEQVVALIDKESKVKGTRGAVGGPKRTIDKVAAGRTDQFMIAFRGQELAQVGLKGDGDCDLDLYVYDESGNLIKSSTRSGDAEIAEWVPAWTGTFAIRVDNKRCGVYANYLLLTN